MTKPKTYYVDVDSDDSFLDYPPLVYGAKRQTSEELRAERERLGLEPAPREPMPLPPLTHH